MFMADILTFDVWADYAHFKKYYTTTSPLTFSIPPKTVIYGIVGAIIGLGKEEYLEYFSPGSCKVGIGINKPIKKIRVPMNLIDTKKARLMSRIDNRTQIRTELLKDIEYRIYFSHVDEKIYEDLKGKLQQHKSYYTVSLGLSEHLADFKYRGEYKIDRVEDNQNWHTFQTALRIDGNNLNKGDIYFTEDKEYFADKIAIEMKPDREVTDYGRVVFERTGQEIEAKPRSFYHLETGESIILL